ncbi:LOW QUALITY PROTEIN: ATPase WRNIP1-like [Nasonia vitripennis]|uniref:Uncharacterized protein n=1 Tax=Nasonia vitripennis TaxID=7425 RepID=A0A7M7Q7F1_NASVI|nr:LOW QUALITY PROTEIN: ATPase WRNIP1-like [Nasonia vitripennis]
MPLGIKPECAKCGTREIPLWHATDISNLCNGCLEKERAKVASATGTQAPSSAANNNNNKEEEQQVKLSAAISGISDVKDAITIASNELKFGRRTVMFMDEIHRFNKTQQDTFLPHIESDTIILIRATTENPSFSLNAALLSRCRVIVLEKLTIENLTEILIRAIKAAGGAVHNFEKPPNASINKIRASDDNAALYWITRMMAGGEDPVYIVRRLVRMATEDIGLEDPKALGVAVHTMQSCKMLGMPECDVLLAQFAIYLARAPKSHLMEDSLRAAQRVVANYKDAELPVPLHLRNIPTSILGK